MRRMLQYQSLKKKNNKYNDKYIITLKSYDSLKTQYNESNNKILKLNDDINDHVTDKKNCLSKITLMNEEILELKKNKDQLIESLSSFDQTISKFEEFWRNVLSDHESVLSNLDKSIPIFKKLLKALEQNEKDQFKPILQIIAHSLQFLKKISSLDESYHSEQQKLSTFTKLTNDSFNTIEKMEKGKYEYVQKRVETLEIEVIKLEEREEDYKTKIAELESEKKELTTQLDSSETASIKSVNSKLTFEIEELQDRWDSLIHENENYKRQVTILITKIKENEHLIEKLQNRIENEDVSNQIEVLKSTNDKLRQELMNKENEINAQNREIINLRDALDEVQEKEESSDHQDIISQKKLENDKVEVKKYETMYLEKLSVLEPQLESLEKYKSQIKELWAANKYLTEKLKKAELDTSKKAEEKALKSMKEKNLIDSAIINTFLIQYLRHNDDPSIQKQMLIAMSGILNFTDEDKKLIGLIERDDDEVGNIGAKFIDYLLEEQ